MPRYIIIWIFSSLVFNFIFTLAVTGSINGLVMFLAFLLYSAPILLIFGVSSALLVEKTLGNGGNYIIIKLLIYGIWGLIVANALYYLLGDIIFSAIVTHFEMNVYSLLASLIFGAFTLLFKPIQKGTR